jgi:hypothetical protein
MRTRTHIMTPLAAVAGGLLAGAVGTVCLDTVQYLRYRRTGTGTTFSLLARVL